MDLLESLQEAGNEILTATQVIVEMTHYYNTQMVVESADAVLGALSAKLRAGAQLSPQEVEEYATLYTALSMLADPNIRAGYNIDLTQPGGQAKFSTILNDTGTNPAVTAEVSKVATENGQARLAQTKTQFTNFAAMKPMDQQLFVNRINKLRIAFERAKQQLSQRELPPMDASKILAA